MSSLFALRGNSLNLLGDLLLVSNILITDVVEAFVEGEDGGHAGGDVKVDNIWVSGGVSLPSSEMFFTCLTIALSEFP